MPICLCEVHCCSHQSFVQIDWRGIEKLSDKSCSFVCLYTLRDAIQNNPFWCKYLFYLWHCLCLSRNIPLYFLITFFRSYNELVARLRLWQRNMDIHGFRSNGRSGKNKSIDADALDAWVAFNMSHIFQRSCRDDSSCGLVVRPFHFVVNSFCVRLVRYCQTVIAGEQLCS